MQREERNKEIVQDVLESIFNREDSSVFGSHPGLKELKKNAMVARAAFPDLRIRIEQQVAEGDMVATHAWLSGTQTGSLFGISPSGKHLEFQAVSVAQVVDDQIVQYNSEVGWLGVLMQLGVLPLQR